MSTIIADPKNCLVRLFDFVALTYGNHNRLMRHINRLPDNLAEWNRTALGREARRVIRDVVHAVEGDGAIYSTVDFRNRYYDTMLTTAREMTQMLRGIKLASSLDEVPEGSHYLFSGERGRAVIGDKLATLAEIEAMVRERVGDGGVVTISEVDLAGFPRVLAVWSPPENRRRLAERAGYRDYNYEQRRYVGCAATASGRGLMVDGDRTRVVSTAGLYEVVGYELKQLPNPEEQAILWQGIRDRILHGHKEEREAAEREARSKVRAAAEDRYSAFRQSLPKVSDMLIPTLPIQEHGTAASRRWGIEVETGAGRDLRGTPKGWDCKDDGSLESAYGEQYIPEDECYFAERHDLEEDDEDYIDPRYCDEHGYVGGEDSDDCVELVSPILTSFHSLGLEQICEDLEHAPRTESAGVHVHVEAKDLTPKQIRNLILIYDRFEPLIESSYDREVRGYCKLRSTRELLSVVRSIDDRNPKDYRDFNKGDRYVTVNLWSLDAHGTVEFRAMGPRYNYDHLIRWAMFCREMVSAAANGATPKDALKVKDWNGVLAFFRKFGVEVNRAESTTDSVLEDAVSAPRELVGV